MVIQTGKAINYARVLRHMTPKLQEEKQDVDNRNDGGGENVLFHFP